MKRFLFGFLAALFFILNTIPYLHILADDMPTSSQYEMLGAFALSTLITSGEATELDFSDYTENDTSFLIDLGEAIFTGDWSGLAEDGLEWLGETADSIYDSYKEYVSQWKYDHLGIMYSNWFPDEQIRVGPDDSYSLAKPLRELLTPRDTNSPTPQPDPDFSFISNINYIYLYASGADPSKISFYDCRAFEYNGSHNQITTFNPIRASAFAPNGDLNSAHTSGFNGNLSLVAFDPIIINLYVDSIDNSCSALYSNTNNYSYFWDSGSSYHTIKAWNWSYANYNSCMVQYVSTPSINFQTSFVGLSTAINYIYNHFSNIDLYVNGSPWVISSGPIYPIVIPGQLTIWNNQPLYYSFPADTHIDLPDLTNIIRNAINSSGVVMWSDIADTYIDINGQTAVAVTKIIRNDYDNLYQEQYPYPAMLVGMTEQTQFNEHLLDNSHAYLSPMGTVVQETVNVLPSELVGVLAIGAILTIFAVIINRLLE